MADRCYPCLAWPVVLANAYGDFLTRNSENPKQQIGDHGFRDFGVLSSFDIRHSDFSHNSPTLCRCEGSFERCDARIAVTPYRVPSVRRRSDLRELNVSFRLSKPTGGSTVG